VLITDLENGNIIWAAKFLHLYNLFFVSYQKNPKKRFKRINS